MAEGRVMLEHQAKALLARYGIDVTREGVAQSAAEAGRIATDIGFPVVMKVVSAGVPHKTDAGGVRLGVADAAAAAEAYDEIVAAVGRRHPAAGIDGVLVAEQIEIEHELLCGVVRDPQFGPVVAFGLGGIFVEVLRDVTFGITPLEEVDALEMIRGIRAHGIIAGTRGRRPVDEDALAAVLIAAGRLVGEHPEVQEMDVNPLAVTPAGRLVALDCLIKLG